MLTSSTTRMRRGPWLPEVAGEMEGKAAVAVWLCRRGIRRWIRPEVACILLRGARPVAQERRTSLLLHVERRPPDQHRVAEGGRGRPPPTPRHAAATVTTALRHGAAAGPGGATAPGIESNVRVNRVALHRWRQDQSRVVAVILRVQLPLTWRRHEQNRLLPPAHLPATPLLLRSRSSRAPTGLQSCPELSCTVSAGVW